MAYIDLTTKEEVVSIDLNGKSENEIIETLFEKDTNYQDNVEYDLFPAKTKENQSWYLADDSYNSNSYTKGLLNASDLKAPSLTSNVHGYDKPLPREHFKYNE